MGDKKIYFNYDLRDKDGNPFESKDSERREYTVQIDQVVTREPYKGFIEITYRLTVLD